MSGTIGILNGPNLNLLGTREPELYGHETLADVEKLCRDAAAAHGFDVDFRQSNHEGVLVDAVHEMRETVGGIVVNAGAYTHTSIALRDALLTFPGPVVEVHLSNVFAREEFRHHSYLSDIAAAVIVGCGPLGYRFAIDLITARWS
ncbi:MAG TPA: type II 3-dehydroquinate dehydratase [Segeticoccus sp.]|uniref:type II 3-dehydroquinate dehydratase n=1 Tax=Segeticoccus sp. TaxID=2706531 RepID=UPI002D7FEC57|nr:type II 3-dehydroquinate dehydratase [Segeticoccus sp.]HET8598890.1 type II 3-dehydroquinate dehydratase [Segeticoccus sp.]